MDTQQLASYLAQRPQWSAPGADGLERAVIRVPADYSEPHGRQLDIAVSRLRATEPGLRRGVLLAVNGGPGGIDGHGVNFPRVMAERSDLARMYDLIGFDPRGTGQSTPLNAYVVQAKTVFDSRPPDDQFDLIAQDMRAREEACQRGGGDLRQHVSTRNTARDIDLIRTALGEEKINFIGYAFGSILGAVYGTLFPGALDRSVLDSCVHPDWTWRELFLKQGEAIKHSVDAWSSWAAEHHDRFGLGTTGPAVLEHVETVAAALGQVFPSPRQRTLFDGAVGNEAVNRARWAHLGDLVRDVRESLCSGANDKASTLLSGTSTWRPGTQQGEMQTGVLEATTLETYWPADLEVYYHDMRLYRERYPYGYGVLRAQPWVGAFRSYPSPEPPTRIRRGDYPTGLIIHADGDPLDNYEGALGMKERLGHRLVTITDSGEHEIYLLAGNPAADEIGNRYLLHGELPEQDVPVPSLVRRPTIP